jgi:tetratricopeptide (TPR) repeat protein
MALDAGWFSEQPARAAAILDSALAAHPFRSLPASDRHYMEVTSAYAAAGRADKARATLAQYDADVRDSAQRRVDEPYRHRAMAAILMAERKGKEAVDEMRRGDTTPDGPPDGCEPCALAPLGRAFDLAGQPDSAIVTMERYVESHFWNRVQIDATFLAGTYKRLGELYEAKGQTDKAVANYSRFLDLWKSADAPLQAKVAEVRQRLRALSRGEKR